MLVFAYQRYLTVVVIRLSCLRMSIVEGIAIPRRSKKSFTSLRRRESLFEEGYEACVKAMCYAVCFLSVKSLKRGGMWRDIYGLQEKKVASIVPEGKVDILVELYRHTHNKLGVMACRHAPFRYAFGNE
ncbi:hypothetical protein Tco_1220672 [Tanacetum coccineum]